MTDSVTGTQGGQGAAAGTEVNGGGDDQAQQFQEIILQQLAFNAAFDGFGEEQRLRQEQKQRQNEDETIS